jgi:hypothetical protein
MLVTAYDAAFGGDMALIQELQALFAAPFDEQSE